MAGTLGIFGICLLFAGVHETSGMTVNIPDKVYKIARGENAVIPCTFTPSTTITSITWTAKADGADDPEINVAGYFGPSKITIYKKYKGRAIMAADTVKGTASLQLQGVTSADTRVYECTVQDPEDEEGSLSDTANLVVLVPPSVPVCKVDGKAEYFQDIKLTCSSAEGTPTPIYKWQSYSVSNVPRQPPPKATEQNGVLSLFNISIDTSGFYVCTSSNEIRSATCNLTLAVMPPSMTLSTAATAGIIAVGAAALLLVGIAIFCCCRRRRDKEEEYAMGTPEGGEFTDKDPEGREDHHDEPVKYEEERRVKSADRRDPQDDRSERSYDRRSDYDDRRDDRSDRRERYDRDDRYDDRRDRHDDRRDRYDDRRDRYDDRRDRYDDRRDRYDDRYDSDRYSDRYDSRDRPPSVPPNKPKEPRN